MDTVDGRGRISIPTARVLMVGAGAVGQVYGYFLQRGSAIVDVLARPRQREELQAGTALYRMRGKRKRQPLMFRPTTVHTDPVRAAEVDYDQIWLCISTTALEAGLREGGLDHLLADAGSATIVVLQNGLHVAELLEPHVNERQVVNGGIAMVAYQAPLTEEEVDAPGVAFYLPVPQPFTGRDAESVVAMLDHGGCPAEVTEDTALTMAFGSATLMPTVAALEGAGWKLSKLRSSRWAKLAARGASEARAVVSEETGERAPPALSLVVSPTLKLLSMVAPVVAPFELEIYLKYHFNKVHDQTVRLIEDYGARARAHGLAHGALDELLRVVGQRSVRTGGAAGGAATSSTL